MPVYPFTWDYSTEMSSWEKQEPCVHWYRGKVSVALALADALFMLIFIL